MANAVIIQDPPHFVERVFLLHPLQVGVPNAESAETGSGRSFYAILEIVGAVFLVGVRMSARDRPIRGQQINMSCHLLLERSVRSRLTGRETHFCSRS